MEVVFDNKNIKELYETGKNRKYRIPPIVLEKFNICIDVLVEAKTINDLWLKPALNFEKLKGIDKYSMRLNKKFRLEMSIQWENNEKTKGIVYILDISVHYGD